MGFNPLKIKIGVLGGGQLGKMMAQEVSKWDLNLHFLDPDSQASCSTMSPNFTCGDFRDYDTVYKWGKDKDLITIEIESVNIEALLHLEKEGVKVYPQPKLIRFIQDKTNQKKFFTEHNIPSAPYFTLCKNQEFRESFEASELKFPLVQKLNKGGYDGKGVQVLNDESELKNLFKEDSFFEKKAEIITEVSVIVVRSSNDEIKCYPSVSMDFHPTANLVEYLVCPAQIPDEVDQKCRAIALKIASELEIVGLLAVEMFYNKDGEIWVNELAPRPHNSGHHTLDNGAVSQFENHIRAILGLPLGNTNFDKMAIMINLLGEENYSGEVIYNGISECLEQNGIYIHLYGKSITKPFRKMGHATIVGKDLSECIEKAEFVKKTLKVVSK
ncbi:MAG TPA: 5-(carboxyamino)imidazole ribonucleotide synthase [Saprospiraceae bacterium]|jgi:5-(carboxyamino)imidazole ribonucleotide synthase|nr:5-(carboxyamino)imidazole ribonucleotide synthase [Saprospiraceae bacterium]